MKICSIENIESLLVQGETETVEFKKSTTQLKSAFETLCAFLNNKGGIVIIGVNSSGKINGQDISDNTRQEIAAHTAKIEPAPQIDTSYLKLSQQKTLISLQVKKGK